MASAYLVTLTGAPEAKIPRKSYTREFKLSVVAFYKNNNLYRTSKYFSLNTKTVLRWVANETKITESPKHSKHCVPIRRAHHPQMEAALVREFKELREKGLKVKGYWFKIRARQLLQQIEPGSTFQFSDGWFDRFKARQNISLRRTTNTAQIPAEDKLSLIRGFHHTIRTSLGRALHKTRRWPYDPSASVASHSLLTALQIKTSTLRGSQSIVSEAWMTRMRWKQPWTMTHLLTSIKSTPPPTQSKRLF